MSTQTIVRSQADVASLVTALRGRDPIRRMQARRTLIKIGKASTPALIEVLSDDREHARWEAAKSLAGIADPVAASALIEAMGDESADVRWVAAEAIIALGRDAVRPLLLALIERRRSVQFCESAHHVLSRLTRRQPAPSLSSVLKALKREEPGLTVPVAVEAALKNMRLKKDSTSFVE